MKERNSCWKVWRIIVTSFLGACGSFSSFIEEKGTQGGLRPQASNKEARALSSPWSFFFWKEKRRRGLELCLPSSSLFSFLFKKENENEEEGTPSPCSFSFTKEKWAGVGPLRAQGAPQKPKDKGAPGACRRPQADTGLSQTTLFVLY